MSPALLERVSTQYRDGYYAGYARKIYVPPTVRPRAQSWPGKKLSSDDVSWPPFGNYDFEQGLEAGANDAYWGLVWSGEVCDIKTRRCGRY